MPASPWEIEEAEEEGVHILNSWGPKEIIARDGKVAAMQFQKYASATQGDRKSAPAFDSSITHTIECDSVILAIGQTTDLSVLPTDTKIKTSRDGLITVDSLTLETDVPGIFAGGDGVTGPKSAVEAIAHGHEAAISIERYLAGLNLKKGREKTKEDSAPLPQGKHPKSGA
jgi:NADPH-dependent glutamate synthase beta subunit-like oxidoreductase